MVDTRWEADDQLAELPYKSCSSSMLCASELASGVQQRWRLEAEQMGKFGFLSHVEAEAHVIVHPSRTRDESKGCTWNLIATDNLAWTLLQLAI